MATATGTPANGVLLVRSEDEAFALLQRALAEEFSDSNVRLDFDGWPTIAIRLIGEGYDSTITAPMAEGLVDLQRAMNRAYARLVKGATSAATLTNEERSSIQFKAKVDEGSSLITVDLSNFAQTIGVASIGKMSSTQLVITVLGLAAVAGGTLAYRWFLKARSEDKKVEQQTKERIALSVQETQRHQILAQALSARPELKHVSEDFDDARTEILKGIADAKSVEVQGVTLTNSDARAIASTPRQKAEDVRLDGVYYIHRIDWSRPDQARLTLIGQDAITREFPATLNTQDLTAQRKTILQSAEWGRQPLQLKINGTELRGEITTAHIVGVAWPEPTPLTVPPT
ncbi:hypothetical protein [Ottowia sp.]|uniref:hypothetical protein n=1 Tax=Ottowia sp. TaxID=1898956 RepID=UPI0026361DE4|nr:hypothetical protein [Ottowia sp.]